jgi:hypothetical protein
MKKLLLASIATLAFCCSFAQVINEICPANADIIHDTTYYNFSPWVELFNPYPTDLDVSHYYLSDNSDNLHKWEIPSGTVIPAKGYMLFWCDGEGKGFHTNFSLDSDGEEIFLVSKSGEVLDHIEFPEQITNIAYGRTSDGGDHISFLKIPTPLTANNAATATTRLVNPEVSRKAGIYSTEQTVTLQHPKSGVTIRFTLDGAEPTERSTIYSTPLVLSKTTTLKAKAFHQSFLPSKTEVKTYIMEDREFSIPIVSVSLDPRYLNDDSIGIYVEGKNGIPGGGMTIPVNWNQNWFRHADFEYFKPDGEKMFDQSLDLRVYGNWSRRKPQKSFALKARDKYGKNHIDHKIFPNKNIYRYGGFLLRNAGTDWNVSHFRDALMHKISIGQLDLEYQDYQPVVLYLNGEYWGIQNLREKIDGDYFESNFDIDADKIDLLEGRNEAELGSREHYDLYLDSLKDIDRNDPKAIKFVERHLDVQNYINYMVHNIYCVNTDWPGNNLKFWRDRTGNGKFRFMLWDMDLGLGMYPAEGDWNHLTLDYVTDAESTNSHNKPWSTLHLRLLLEIPVFKHRFIQTMLTSLQTTYDSHRLNKIIDEFERGIEDEMPYHKKKWGGSVEDWRTQIQRIRTFNNQRNAFLQQHTIEFFNLKNQVAVNVTATPENGGSYQLNGIETNKGLMNALYFKGLAFAATAKPNDGYIFKGWKVRKKNASVKKVIPTNDEWRYHDKGVLPALDWTSTNFDDADWSAGEGQLGYGDGDEQTKLNYGASLSNKYTAYYFRKHIDVADINDIEDIAASMHYDDGAVVYVNGIEVARVNMPTGTIDYSTLASSSISIARDMAFSIDKSVFVNGKNVIAVEIHQGTLTSSDLSFDFELSWSEIGEMTTTAVSSARIEGVAYSDVTLEAEFQQISGLVINEFSSANSTLEDEHGDTDDWIELYNAGSEPVSLDGLYITDDLTDKRKYKFSSNAGTVNPGEYAMIWADNQTDQGGRHISFKLADAGEALGLYKKDGNDLIRLSEVIFGMQMNNQSWSRLPNATGPFGLTYYNTPNEENSNILTVVNDEVSFKAFPNPTTGTINLTFNTSRNQVQLVDVYGRLVKDMGTVGTKTEADLSELPSGVYILSVRTSKGVHATRIVKQ